MHPTKAFGILNDSECPFVVWKTGLLLLLLIIIIIIIVI